MIQWIFHFVKFQPKGLPYTPEQWAPNNPDGEYYMILVPIEQKTFDLVALRVQLFYREKAVWAGLPPPTAKKSTVLEETGMLTLLFAFTPRFFFWFIGATWFNLKLLFCHRMPCPPTWRSSGTRSTRTACAMLHLLQSETRSLISFFLAHNSKWNMFLNTILPGSLLPYN